MVLSPERAIGVGADVVPITEGRTKTLRDELMGVGLRPRAKAMEKPPYPKGGPGRTWRSHRGLRAWHVHIGVARELGRPCHLRRELELSRRGSPADQSPGPRWLVPRQRGSEQEARGGTSDRRKRRDEGWVAGSRSAQYDLRWWGTLPRGPTGGKGAPESWKRRSERRWAH